MPFTFNGIFTGIMQSDQTILTGRYGTANYTNALAYCESINQTLLTVPSQDKEDAVAPLITSTDE